MTTQNHILTLVAIEPNVKGTHTAIFSQVVETNPRELSPYEIMNGFTEARSKFVRKPRICHLDLTDLEGALQNLDQVRDLGFTIDDFSNRVELGIENPTMLGRPLYMSVKEVWKPTLKQAENPQVSACKNPTANTFKVGANGVLFNRLDISFIPNDHRLDKSAVMVAESALFEYISTNATIVQAVKQCAEQKAALINLDARFRPIFFA
jgi:hypothetical protein